LITGGLPGSVADALAAFLTLLGRNDAMAYLVNMAPRLVELHRVLKPTGSLYLHCDPTMSHYLKMMLDAIFGPEMFRSEIVWRRYGSHNDAKGYGSDTDPRARSNNPTRPRTPRQTPQRALSHHCVETSPTGI
jgi:site-specific DNA-methyltransferase (adenine-specific)